MKLETSTSDQENPGGFITRSAVEYQFRAPNLDDRLIYDAWSSILLHSESGPWAYTPAFRRTFPLRSIYIEPDKSSTSRWNNTELDEYRKDFELEMEI